MNELVSNKKTAILLLIAFIFVIFAAIYYYFINPLFEEKSLRETSLSSVQSEVAILEAEIASANSEEKNEENVYALQKKVPLKRELEKLILLLEAVETNSGTKVQNITFNDYDSLVVESELVQGERTTEEATSTDEVLEDEIPVSPIASLSLPYQLKLLTFNVEVLAQDYDSLIKFINDIESEERVIKVDEIMLSTEEEGLVSSVQITTFFYDGE